MKFFILYWPSFSKNSHKNQTRFSNKNQTIFQNKVFMTFSKNQTRFSEIFDIFFRNWGKSYKIFNHLSKKGLSTMFSKWLHSFHKNPTRFLSNFQKTWQDHSKNSQHVFTNTKFWKDYQNFHKIPQSFIFIFIFIFLFFFIKENSIRFSTSFRFKNVQKTEKF